jgi:hypothetical protein
MFTEITSDNAGQAALSRFGTTNTWNAQQIFKGSATTTPGAIFQAFGTTSAVPAIDPNGIAIFQGAEATAGHVQFSASGSATHVVFRRNNGTYASPTALAANDIIGSLQWQGRGASTFGTTPAAQIRGVATEIFTETARGTQLEFYTTPPTTITNTLRLTLGATATFTTPVQATESQINGTATTNRFLYWQTSGSIRWGFYANNSGESTGNVGSDLLLARYSDAGGLLNGAVLNINRATGNIITEGAIAIGRRMTSAVVALTDGANIALDASLGNHFRVTLAGNRTLNAPTNPVDGQRIHVEFIQDATGSRTITLTTGALGFAFGTDIPSITLTTTANLRDFIECVYNSTAQRWYVVRFVKGY